MNETEKKINNLFDELVPPTGKANTVAGEIIRAISRLGYRNYNDGDHLGVGYGKETCNPAGRYLAAKCDEKTASLVWAAWGILSDEMYDAALQCLEESVVSFLEANPNLKTTPNTEDMFDYRDKYEDVDESDEDDEEYW